MWNRRTLDAFSVAVVVGHGWACLALPWHREDRTTYDPAPPYLPSFFIHDRRSAASTAPMVCPITLPSESIK
jgi:hypothetical protein